MSDNNPPKIFEIAKDLSSSSLNPINAIANATNSIISSISNAKSKMVESDNNRDIENKRTDAKLKIDIASSSITGIANAVSSVSNVISKSKETKAKIVESDNNKDIENKKTDAMMKTSITNSAISGAANVGNSIISSISYAFGKSKESETRISESKDNKTIKIAESDNNKDIENKRTDAIMKVEIVKEGVNLTSVVLNNTDAIVDVLNTFKEAKLAMAEIEADLEKNQLEFEKWKIQANNDLIKFQEASNNTKEIISSYSRRLEKITDTILSIPTDTLNVEEIKIRTQLLEKMDNIDDKLAKTLFELLG
ncbi:hypothetical protein, partial [Brachyspira hampsonii]